MKKSLRILTAISIIAWASLDAFAQHAPDLILFNGKIFTADETQRYVQALAIEGNRIVAIGKTADVQALATNKTRKIDLKGKTVVPGFNDAHCWKVLKLLMLVSVGQTLLMLWEHMSNDFLFDSNFYYGYLTGIPQLLTASILFYCAVNSESVIRKFIMVGLFFLVIFYFLPVCVDFTNFHELPFYISLRYE